MLCISLETFVQTRPEVWEQFETAEPQACEGQSISSVSHMNARQKLDGSDSFVIVLHVHGPPENIWFILEDIDVRGILLDEFVLFFFVLIQDCHCGATQLAGRRFR